MGKVNVVQCPRCGDEVIGKTHAEAVEDAVHLGWDYRPSPRQMKLTCAACLDEEDTLV